jgi:hypothetical protein
MPTNAKDGASTCMGYANSVNADPYGTALNLLTQDGGDTKICAQVTDNMSAAELENDTVGCGARVGFGNQVRLGQREYKFGLAGDLGFRNGFDRLAAQFFGLTSAPVVQGTGGYLHTFTMAQEANKYFGTFSYETGDASVMELKSTYTQKLMINMSAVRNFIRWGADLVANDIEVSGAEVNTNADLQSLAFVDRELVFPQCVHKNWLAPFLDDGTDTALSAGNQFNITSYQLELETPLETIDELTGGNCNTPTQSGKRVGTLTLGIKEHVSNVNTYIPWKNGTYYSNEIEFLGSALGAAFKTIRLSLPKLCLVATPGYNIQNPGRNGFNLVFRVLEASNIRGGNIVGYGPQMQIINTRATRYLVP